MRPRRVFVTVITAEQFYDPLHWPVQVRPGHFNTRIITVSVAMIRNKNSSRNVTVSIGVWKQSWK